MPCKALWGVWPCARIFGPRARPCVTGEHATAARLDAMDVGAKAAAAAVVSELITSRQMHPKLLACVRGRCQQAMTKCVGKKRPLRSEDVGEDRASGRQAAPRGRHGRGARESVCLPYVDRMRPTLLRQCGGDASLLETRVAELIAGGAAAEANTDTSRSNDCAITARITTKLSLSECGMRNAVRASPRARQSVMLCLCPATDDADDMVAASSHHEKFVPPCFDMASGMYPTACRARGRAGGGRPRRAPAGQDRSWRLKVNFAKLQSKKV